MRFADPIFLWLLIFIPVMAIYAALFRAGDFPSFRLSTSRATRDIPGWEPPNLGVWAESALRLIALTVLILGLARPQRGLRSEEMTTKATDIVFCLDASRSMLSVDFKPDNRFQVAKGTIADFIKRRDKDRLGLVLFAEQAVTQCPLTTDRNAILQILDGLEVGAIPPDHTAIGIGLATAVNRLKNSQAKSKVIILLTDGANNAGSIDPLTAAKTAAAFGIKIYSIGVGSPDGGLMPVDDPVLGRRYIPIQADLNEDELLRIAEETHGKYFRAKSGDALKPIFQEIDGMEKTDIKVHEYVDYQEMYVWYLVVGAALLLLELGLAKTVFRVLP